MNFREAKIEDIKQIQDVRKSVKENKLSNPDSVTEQDYKNFITTKGKTWVCEVKNLIVAFATVDTVKDNVWALFVAPRFEDQGIGKQLHNMMLNWYFQQGKESVWLSTEANTRAEQFYKFSEWTEVGTQDNGEIKFEMTAKQWQNL